MPAIFTAFLVIVLLFQVHPQTLDATRYSGLQFSGNYHFTSTPPLNRIPLPKEKRSLFHITKSKKIFPGDKYSIGFVFCLWENTTGGEVFSLKGEKYHISFVYRTAGTDRTAVFELLLDGKKTGISFSMPVDMVYDGHWFPFLLEINEQNGNILVKMDGNSRQGSFKSIKKSEGFDLRFGREPGSGNCLPMILKDLKFSSAGNLLHHWLFTELTGSLAYDSEGGLDAETENCEWLINKHFYWEPAISADYRESNIYPRAAPSPEYIHIDKNGIRIYNLRNKTRTKIVYPMNDFKFFMVSPLRENDSLISAHSGYPDKPGVLNFRTGRFLMQMDKITPDGHHYGGQSFVDQTDTTVYLYGGYGWYKFKNILLKYNKYTQKWDTCLTTGEKPLPGTYFSTLKSLNRNRYYIFGGIGVESGRQEDAQHPLWDLFELDLRTLTWKKIWKWNNPENLITTDLAVWADRNQSAFYSICRVYEKGLNRIYYLSLSDSNMIAMGDTLPGQKEGLVPNELYIDYETQIVYIRNFAASQNDSIPVFHKIRTPILTDKELMELKEASTPFKIERRNRILKYSAIILVFIGVPAVFFFFLMKRRKKRRAESESNPETGYDPAEKYVSLFGGLTIVNDKGERVDEGFTPKLAELFAIILYYSTPNPEHGVLFSRLEQILWVDIPPENIKNNRNVAFSKLRSLITANCNMTVVTESDSVKIILPPGMINEQKLINDLLGRDLNLWSDPDLNRFLKIVSRGEYLAEIHSDWATGVRTEMVSAIIKKSVRILDTFYNNQEYETCVQISDIILIQDPLGEEVLKFKLRSLTLLGREPEAKKEFNSFRRGFKRRYKEEFSKNFGEFIESKND